VGDQPIHAVLTLYSPTVAYARSVTDINLDVFNALGTRNGTSYGELYKGIVSAEGTN
jgi:hypothetical protein